MMKFIRFILCCLFVSFGLFAAQDQFGLNTHNFPCENTVGDAGETLFRQLNVNWIRADINWKDIEKDPVNKPGEYTFAPVDRIVSYAHNNNINVLFLLTYAPMEYRRLGVLYFDYINPIHVDKWTAFVTAMVNRYKSTIKYWEIWNEPNCVNGDWEDKANELIDWILKPAIAAIEAADPEAKICGPALLSNKPGDDNHIEWFDLITQSGVNFDVLTYHQYHGGNTALGRFNELKEFHDHADNIGYAGKPFWITETGWPVDNSLGNAVQNMQDMLDLMLANNGWWNKTFWFAYRDTKDIMPLILYYYDEPTALYYIFKSYTNPPHVTVTSPNGGEPWARGKTYSIQWNSSFVANVKIELMEGTAVHSTIIASTPADDGVYGWTVSPTQAVASNYKIRISGQYNGETFSDSSNANFSITCNEIPYKPALILPIDNAKLNITTPTLKWSAVTTCPAVDKYKLQIKYNGSAVHTVDNIPSTSTSYKVPATTLSFGKTYKWYVWAHNTAGWGEWSGRTMTLIYGNKPTAPVLISPANNEENVALRPILKWNAVTATPPVDYYEVQINFDGSQIHTSGNVTSASYQVPFNVLGTEMTYQWYVRALNALGFSAWSMRTFTTRPSKPDPPDPIMNPDPSDTDK